MFRSISIFVRHGSIGFVRRTRVYFMPWTGLPSRHKRIHENILAGPGPTCPSRICLATSILTGRFTCSSPGHIDSTVCASCKEWILPRGSLRCFRSSSHDRGAWLFLLGRRPYIVSSLAQSGPSHTGLVRGGKDMGFGDSRKTVWVRVLFERFFRVPTSACVLTRV